MSKNGSERTAFFWRYRYAVLGIFTFLLYAQTIGFNYTLDDAIVIYDNEFTQQGIGGIADIFSYDTFRGFFKVEGKDQLVAGGRYRPLTLAFFAIEYQLVGANPWLGHLINVLLYSLFCIILLQFVEKYVSRNGSQKWLGFFMVILFAAHPIHSEVVANIKGRDEILSALFGLLALRSLFSRKHGLAVLWMTLAMFSKEMAATWVAVAVLYVWLMDKKSITVALTSSWPLWLGFAIYMIARFAVLGWSGSNEPIMEMMNNPFVKLEGNEYVLFTAAERFASIFYALGKYIYLLVIPYPLTHDYYPRSIPITSLSNAWVLLSIGAHVMMLAGILLWRKKWPIASWLVGFYLVSLVLISNILFPIGTHMGERFVFMASIPFVLGWVWKTDHFLPKKIARALWIIFLLLYTGMTLNRLPVWKNDYTLFTHDVHRSPNSAKVLNAAGGSLVDECISSGGENCDEKKLNSAVDYLKNAIGIHPNYKSAHFILGNAYFLQKEYTLSIQSYKNALRIDPDIHDGRKNLKLAYINAAKLYGEQQGDAAKALDILSDAEKFGFQDPAIWRLQGVASGVTGNFEQALLYFKKIIKQNPNDGDAIRNVGITYMQMGQEEEGMNWIRRAEEIEGNE